MIASEATISRYRSSRRCSKRVIEPSGGMGGGLSHFRLKRIGRPLMVRDTAEFSAVESGVATRFTRRRVLTRALRGIGRVRRVGLQRRPPVVVRCGGPLALLQPPGLLLEFLDGPSGALPDASEAGTTEQEQHDGQDDQQLGDP